MDKTYKISFTMEIAGDTNLEFLDLKLKIVEAKVNIFANHTNSFSWPHLTPVTLRKTYVTYLNA